MTRAVGFLLIGEAAVGVVAWTALTLLDDVPTLHVSVEIVGLSLVLILLLAGTNLVVFEALKRAAPGNRVLEPVRELLEDELFPVLRTISPFQILLLSALAGVGEELFFRGLLQPRLGIFLASVIFGVVHGPQRSLWPLALWATIMGWLLGLMYVYSNSLTLPILVHAGYDAMAIGYIRLWQPAKNGPEGMTRSSDAETTSRQDP